jgi:hypothetical protein
MFPQIPARLPSAITKSGSGANSVIGLADEGAGESPTGRGVLLRARAIAEFGR